MANTLWQWLLFITLSCLYKPPISLDLSGVWHSLLVHSLSFVQWLRWVQEQHITILTRTRANWMQICNKSISQTFQMKAWSNMNTSQNYLKKSSERQHLKLLKKTLNTSGIWMTICGNFRSPIWHQVNQKHPLATTRS